MKQAPKPSHRIADLPDEERPRERLALLGPGALSKAELLAILIRVGVPGESAVQVGERLLRDYKNLHGLHQTPFVELCKQHGIGAAKACQILAAIELGARMADEQADPVKPINSPEEAANLVRFELSGLEEEHLRVILLDTRNRKIAIVEVYSGSVNSAQVHVGEVFREAIRRNASAVIVAHNHPSGDPTPSPDDIAVTRSIIQAGKLLEIEVLDHLVIGQMNWVSMKERGLGFSLSDQ